MFYFHLENVFRRSCLSSGGRNRCSWSSSLPTRQMRRALWNLRCGEQPAGNIHEENGMFMCRLWKEENQDEESGLGDRWTGGTQAHGRAWRVFSRWKHCQRRRREKLHVYTTASTRHCQSLIQCLSLAAVGSYEEPRSTQSITFASRPLSTRPTPLKVAICAVSQCLEPAIEQYRGQAKELEKAVREELGTWFPERAVDIKEKWELKGFYYIPNAQPAQFGGPFPANVNGGRDCTMYRGKKLPEGLVVCGDHMATATLNGALESGLNAGKVAAKNSKRVVVNQ